MVLVGRGGGIGARRRWAAVASCVVGLGLAVVPARDAAATPVNDDFYGTIIGLGYGVSAVGSNVGATVQEGEPEGLNPDWLQHTVWFTWDSSPSYRAPVTITVNNADFDTELAVFYGGSIDSLVHVVSNDDANTTTNESQVTFLPNFSTNYRIQVDGWGGAMGSFVLSVGIAETWNDFPGVALSGTTSERNWSTSRAGGEAGEPDIFPSDASAWYSWTAPESGLARITTAYSSFDTTAAVFSGDTVAQLTPLAWNDDYTTVESLLDVSVTAGQTYRIQVDGKGVGVRGDYHLELALNPPANDLFAMATSLSGRTGSVDGTTVRAMAEPGEAGDFHTVWFTYTPTRSGSVAFEIGVSPASVRAYTGSSIIGLTEVGTATNWGTTFSVNAGTAYRISVADWETGFKLRWSDTPCDGRIPTIVGSGSIVGTSGDDVILGSNGADTIDGLGGRDTVCGSGGADVLAGGADPDRVLGGAGKDTLRDGPGADVALGGSGNDLIIAEPVADGSDMYDGEGGVDTVSYRYRAASVTVILDASSNDGAAGEFDRVVAESVIGGGAGDTITGNAGPNRLTGLAGNDVLTGGAGPDVVLGGGGDDSLYVQDGVGGNDIADGGPGVDQATADPGDTVRRV